MFVCLLQEIGNLVNLENLQLEENASIASLPATLREIKKTLYI